MLMKGRLTINNSVCGRWLLSLFTMLFVSVGMQAENYGLTVGDVQVTSDNAANITGTNITAGTVSFSNGTLTLNGATINGTISSSIADLKVKLVGVSVFNVAMDANSCTYVFNYTGSGNDASPSLTFSADNLGATLLAYGDQENNNLELVSGYTVSYNPDVSSWINTYRRDTGTDDKPFIRLSKPYPITIAGESVDDSNKDNVMGDEMKSVSYDATNKILTLKGANFGTQEGSPIVVGEEISALTLHLIGNSLVYSYDNPIISFANTSPSLTVTTSEKLPGSLSATNLSTIQPTLQNGLTYNDGTISALLANTEVSQFTGRETYVNTDNGDNSFIYGSNNFYASYATNVNGSRFVKVSTNDSGTTAAMWQSDPRYVELQQKVTLQFGALTANDVTVQVIGWKQVYDNEGVPTGFVADGKTYSDVIALSTADADGIIEIPLTSTVTSENLQLVFSSSSSFSFMPISIAFTTAPVYDIRIGRVSVSENNASNITGEGITGTVSYDDVNHILTLNNATINWEEEGESTGIDYSGTASLTIKLIGTNKVGGTGGCEAICYTGEGQETHPKLIFTKGDNKTCSLMLNADAEFEGTVISGGFSEIQGVWGIGTTDNGLAIIADKEVKYDSEDGLTIEKVVNYTVNYVPLSSTLIASYYGLAISGVPVYEGNKSNITGEGIYGNGTASFDLTTNTLTLNNVNLNPDYAQNDGDLRVSIVTSLAQLNINLIGESQTYAIKTTNESGTLTFKSAEANRGAARLNFWYNAEPYYIGYGENKVTYNDGLCLREDSYNSSFPMIVALNVPKVITNEKERGLYYPDHEFTFSLEEEVEGFDIYYANMLGGDPVKTTNGKFTLAEGRYTLRVYPIYPGMDADPSKNSQFASERYAKVIAKPTFSKENGTYNESFTLTLQNVPEQDAREEWAEGLSENIMVPQVWYYINDNKNDSIRYDATKGISVTESCKVSVYIIDVDSAKKLKSQPVEAQYVIRQTPGYHFSTSSTGQSYTPSGSTISNLDYGSSSNVLPRLINVPSGLSITYNSSDENVATVSSTGVITLTGAGYVWISASNAATDVYAAHEERVRLEIRPSDPVISLEHGIYYTGQKVTLTPTVPNGTMYYSFGYNGDWVEYNEGDVITLPKGNVELYAYTRCGTEQEHMDSYGNGHTSYYVYDEPTFSVASGTYNEEQYVTIGNLPTDGQGTVYYYFYDETLQEEDANMVEYHANDVITVTESSILKALIARVDTGKQIKTQPVEAQYVIRQDAGLAYMQHNEPVKVAVYTIGATDNEDLPELVNENGVAVTYSSDDENVATVNAETGAVTIVGIGKTTITATSAQTATLQAGEAAYTLRVYKDLNYESITVTVADATYTGEAVEPTVTVMDGETDITELMIISYDNNVEVGNNATVTIVPNNDLEVNFYVGSRTKTFSIVTRTLEIGKDVNFASGQKWASFYTTTEDLLLPEGVMAYIVTAVGNDVATVKAINYVPKNVPVLIEKESTTTTDNMSAEGNLLQGTAESTAVSGIEGNVYVLYNGGFTRTTSGAIPAKRAYLVLEQAAGARLSIVEGEATDITSVGYDSVVTEGSTYDMQGRKVESLSKKGLYIKNGRKVVIK